MLQDGAEKLVAIGQSVFPRDIATRWVEWASAWIRTAHYRYKP